MEAFRVIPLIAMNRAFDYLLWYSHQGK